MAKNAAAMVSAIAASVSVIQSSMERHASAPICRQTASRPTAANPKNRRYARVTAAATATSASAKKCISASSAKALPATAASSTRCAFFMSRACSASSAKSSSASAPTTKTNARRRAERCINQSFTTISRVCRRRFYMRRLIQRFSLTQADANIQCIARVRYDDDTVCEYKFTYELGEVSETSSMNTSKYCCYVD